MTQPLVSTLAAACREFADAYDPQGGENEPFMDAWRDTFAAYEAMLAACPSCKSDDPGNPPPP